MAISRNSSWLFRCETNQFCVFLRTFAESELGLRVVERRIRRSELYLADEVFLTGTAAHIIPVGELDNRPIGNGGVGPITQQLRDLYLDLIRGGNPKYEHWTTAVTPGRG